MNGYWVLMLPLIGLILALLFDHLHGRVDREWIRRLQGMERGRKQQEMEHGKGTK